MITAQQLIDVVNRRLTRDEALSPEDLEVSFADLGIDSLDRMLLLVAVQEAFPVSISDEQASEFKNLKDLADFINSQG